METIEALLEEPEVKRWWPDEDYEHDHGWVIEVDGRFAGWIQYEEETYEWFPSVALDISLTTSLHGAGYGRRALRLAIDHFAARGHHRFTIDPTWRTSAPSARTAGAGFEPVGVMRAYQRDPRAGGTTRCSWT